MFIHIVLAAYGLITFLASLATASATVDNVPPGVQRVLALVMIWLILFGSMTTFFVGIGVIGL